MQLKCKEIKKVATPHFYINPSFQSYPPFLAKFLVPPKYLNFWKVLPNPLSLPPKLFNVNINAKNVVLTVFQ